MSEMQGKQRSAVVFGARNLGRAVIELLVSDGWAVTGVARSRSTLDGVSAAGALALKGDVTDPASVYGVLERAAAAHGGVELVMNAVAAVCGGRVQHELDSAVSSGRLLQHAVHARRVRHVGLQRERPGRADAVQGAPRPRHPRHRPAVAHQQLDDRATQIAGSEHNRTSLLTLHLAHRIARFRRGVWFKGWS